MGDRDALLSQFTDVTGIDAERARFYLESSAWQLEVALASFYENDADVNQPADEPQIVNEIPAQANEAKPKPKPGGIPYGSRFATVANLAPSEGSSDEEEGQAFYAGGSERSGQQIIGPGKKKKDIVTEMFKSVQEHGAEIVDPKNPMQKKRQPTFQGTGYRLGQSNNDTEVIPSASASREDSLREVTLKLWKEGFSIDDGPLKEFADPENREFLDTVRRGEVPMELMRESRGGEVHLNMEDHRHEDFVRIRFKPRAFAGEGHVLGSPSPAAIGSTKPMDEIDKAANEAAAKSSVTVDHSEPLTTIQIRLADGSRLLGQFNHSHTVADLRRYITTARPQYEHQTFILLTIFPNKELTENSQTLKQAGILNASLLQRLA